MNLKIFTRYLILVTFFWLKTAHAAKIDANKLTIALGTITIETTNSEDFYQLSKFPTILLHPGSNILGDPSGTKKSLLDFNSTIFLPGAKKPLPLLDKNNQIIIKPKSTDSYYTSEIIQLCKTNYTDWKGQTKESKVIYITLKQNRQQTQNGKNNNQTDDYPLDFTLYFNNDSFAKYLDKLIPNIETISWVYGYFINISFNPYGKSVYTDSNNIDYRIIIKSIDVQAQLAENAPKNPGGFITISITVEQLLKYPEILAGFPGLAPEC